MVNGSDIKVKQVHLKVKQVHLKRNVINKDGSILLIYATTEGQVIGQMEVTAINAEALKAMAQDFPLFVSEQAGGLVAAPAGMMLPPRRPA